jgi:hypothetical protein
VTPADTQGLEYDWLASDADGHVALFSTAGGGRVPDEFLRDVDLYDAAIKVILRLPTRTGARFAPTLPAGLQNDWKLMAERGLFAFDSDPNGGPYRVVSAPNEPMRLTELPEEVAAIAGRIVFDDLRFAALTELPETF